MNRGRSSLRDSYGNPAEYDTLAAIDNKEASKTHSDPNMFIIPGYASGILQPHELPTRSNFAPESSRKIEDDRIHFVDPLQNSFQSADKAFQAPSPSLSTPLGTGVDSANTQQAQSPIDIPKPNIDLPETPQTPIDDPLNQPLHPPQESASSSGAPSFELEAPRGESQQFPLTQGLIPPQVPSDGQSVFIPRPNLDIPETPIDNSNGPGLNQGLLPPTGGSDTKAFDNSAPIFPPLGQDGPVVINEGDVLFANKPSNGLLPPKDPQANDVNFALPDQPATAPTPSKFDGVRGVIGHVANNINKFTGSFGGAPGILGGKIQPPTQQTQVPVTVVQGPITKPSLNVFSKPANDQRYQGNFGGPPGVLTSNNQNDGTIQAQPTVPIPSIAPTNPTVALENKFSGSFGGPPGVLGDPKAAPTVPILTPTVPAAALQTPTTQTITQLPSLANNYATKETTVQKYTGQFGGAPGVLTAYDRAN